MALNLASNNGIISEKWLSVTAVFNEEFVKFFLVGVRGSVVG